MVDETPPAHRVTLSMTSVRHEVKHKTGGCYDALAMVKRVSRRRQEPGRVVAYRRVSTTDQAASGLGLDAQLREITAYATRHGLTVATVFTDEGVSGAAPLTERKALLAALQALGPGDTLLVAKLDRLSRGEPLEQAIIDELVARRRAKVVSTSGEGTAGDGPTETLMRGMLQLFARFERDLIRARTTAALQAKKARGERVGTLPYGQTETERRVLAAIEKYRATGLSLQGTADALNRHGFTTRTGSPWRPQYVASILATQRGTRQASVTKGRRAVAAALALAGV